MASRSSRAIQTISGCLLVAALARAPALAGEIRLTIKGVRSDLGELLVGLYTNQEGFRDAIAKASTDGLSPDKQRLVGMAMRARAGAQTMVFTDLPAGRYALIAFHDANDNGRLDANALGVPTEGYGFSNDAHALLRAPDFDAAAIVLTSDDSSVAVSISLIYPRAILPGDELEYRGFTGRSRPPPPP